MAVGKNVKTTYERIKNMRIQGAKRVAVEGVKSLKNVQSMPELRQSCLLLAKSRPTEPMLRNGLRFVFYSANEHNLKATVRNAINKFVRMNDLAVDRIADIAAKRINSGDVLMTYCHSSTVTETMRRAKKQGKRFEVIVSETRPRYQGRITARELRKSGIKTTMIVDSAVRSFINDADLILMGSDAITSDGYVVNKIGSATVALCAQESRTRLGVLSELFKFDPMTSYGTLEPIEERPGREVWPTPPAGLKIRNPAFDVIPPAYIDYIVTEAGVTAPYNVINQAKSRYPWMVEQW
jgi:ribose 1,5-bisphosphate isomerase